MFNKYANANEKHLQVSRKNIRDDFKKLVKSNTYEESN